MQINEGFAVHIAITEPEESRSAGWPERDTSVLAVLEELQRAQVPIEEVEYSTHGYGYGADTTAAGIVLTSLTAAFFAGKKVEENIDAWLRLGRRLRDALSSVRERRISVAVSEPAVVALALEFVARETGEGPLSLLSVTTIPVDNPSLVPAIRGKFMECPDRYHVIVIKAGHERVDVVAMSARGRLIFHNILALNKSVYHYLGN